jgi:GDP-mannose 6-dehydrogenase
LDTKLNLSSYYLRPGFAFGGSCLPKDLRALLHQAQSLDVDVPVIRAIAQSNEIQVKSAVRRILALGKKKVGVLGFAFKSGTDDLRNSPVVDLIGMLLGKGCDIRIYDGSVNLAKLFGTNKEYIERHIPHIADLMTDNLAKVMDHAEVIVVGNQAEEFKAALRSLREGQHVFDLVRVSRDARRSQSYDGMSW